jgi:hypothetical protein
MYTTALGSALTTMLVSGQPNSVQRETYIKAIMTRRRSRRPIFQPKCQKAIPTKMKQAIGGRAD